MAKVTCVRLCSNGDRQADVAGLRVGAGRLPEQLQQHERAEAALRFDHLVGARGGSAEFRSRSNFLQGAPILYIETAGWGPPVHFIMHPSSRRSSMKVKDAMHKGVDWVSPDTPVTELAKLMREHDIGAIPIGENDRLVGMVTDRDIVCKGLAQDDFDAGRATARDVMTPGIHCCRDDDDLAKAVQHMEALKVRRLPVINKGKRMVGILSLGDISHSAPGAVLTEWAKSVSAHH